MNKMIEFLVFSSFFFNLAFGLLGPIYALYVAQIGGDIIAAGFSFAAFTIICGISITILGSWEDKAKHKENLLIASRVLTFFGFAGYFFITNVSQLVVVQAILGASLALGTPVFDFLYSKNIDKKRAAFEWGVWEGSYQLAFGVSAIIGAVIADLFGFKALFSLMTLFAFISLAMTMLFYGSESKAKTRSRFLHARVQRKSAK